MKKLKNRCLFGFAIMHDDNRLTQRLQEIFFYLIDLETPFSCYCGIIFFSKDLTMCIVYFTNINV